MAEPMVMSSNPIWFWAPPKSTDLAVPENVTPRGTSGLKLPVGSGAPLLGVSGRARVARTVPVAFRPS